MRAPCIVNLENIRTLSNWLGKRLPVECHRNWIDHAILRHVLNSQDCLQASAPTREELSSLHVFRAVAAGEATVHFVPTERLMKDADLVVDWLAGLDERDPRLSRKLRRVTFEDALTMSQRWHEQLRKAAKRKERRAIPPNPVGAPAVLDEPWLGPGWHWVWLKSRKSRKAEGEAMGHCVGSGGYESLDSSEAILSLRDREGMPHVTMHLYHTRILQSVGRGNEKVSERYLLALNRTAAIIGTRLLLRDDPVRLIPDGLHQTNRLQAYVRSEMLHCDNGPAVEWVNGGKSWWHNGRCHREHGPAVERVDGTKEWYRDGKLHREDGPAIERADGTKRWYRHGKLHREDGPVVEGANGIKMWFRYGKLHREDGPAVEGADGGRSWYRHGRLHRDDGPAVQRADGDDEWWRNGERIAEHVVTSQAGLSPLAIVLP